MDTWNGDSRSLSQLGDFRFRFSNGAEVDVDKMHRILRYSRDRESDKPGKLIIIGRGKYAKMRNANAKCAMQTRWQSAKSIIRWAIDERQPAAKSAKSENGQ